MSRSLTPLLFPQSVAVIGRGQRGLARLVVEHIRQGGFAGELSLLFHEEAGALTGQPLVDSLEALPAAPELVVVVVPAAQVLGVLRACSRRGSRAALVLSAGAWDPAGLAEAAGEMLLLGPNCMGLINTHPQARVHASFGVHPVESGSVAFISHSGSVADYALYHHRAWGLGFSLVASVGQEADVTMGELVQAAAADERTTVIALYLEEPAEPVALLQAMAATDVPVVVLKGGRTELGARAAASHTGRLTAAAGAAPVEALLERAGALVVHHLDELMAQCAALTGCPTGAGRRVGLVANAGGPAVLAVDTLQALGLELVDASQLLPAQGPRELPAWVRVDGPVIDVSATARPEHFGQAARLVQGQADSLLALVMSPEGQDPQPVAQELRQGWSGPLAVAVLAGGESAGAARRWLGQQGVAACREPELAARVLAGLALRRAGVPPPPVPAQGQQEGGPGGGPGAEAAEELLRRHQEAGRLTLPLGQALTLCQTCGVPVVPYGRVPAGAGVDTVVRLADQLGYPVVLKVDGSSVNHRTERGLVSEALPHARAVAAVVARWAPQLDEQDPEAGLVVQAFAPGTELLVGCTVLPRWGPVAVVGWGGVEAEAWAEVAYLGLPLTAEALLNALHGLRGSRRLGRWRGAPAVQLNSLVDAALRLSELVCQCPRIEAIELSPFMASRSSAGPEGAVDVRLVLRPDGGEAG